LVCECAQLKQHISNNFKNWSDLELALGAYTKHTTTLEEFDEVFEDIGNNLVEYLISQEKKLDFKHEKTNKEKLFEDLSFPENTLTAAEKEQLSNYKNNWSNIRKNIIKPLTKQSNIYV